MTFKVTSGFGMKKSKTEIVGWVFIVLHLVGIAGFSIAATRSLFQWLTPFNLLLSLILLLWTHPRVDMRFILLSITIAVLGYTVEVAGVNSGQIFGEYQYGNTLGFKLWNTPLIIGANWLMMVYYSGTVAKRLTDRRIGQVLMGAVIMLGMDLLIEPVAITYDYWTWTGGSIPLQNYVSWFAISLVFHAIYMSTKDIRANNAAIFLATAQLIFFAVLNFL